MAANQDIFFNFYFQFESDIRTAGSAYFSTEGEKKNPPTGQAYDNMANDEL